MARRTTTTADHRKTVTRSVSFDQEMFDFMEDDRRELRLDRSQYLRERLEERREAKHRAAHGKAEAATGGNQTRNGLPLFPKRARAGRATLKLVNELRDATA